MKRNLKSRLTDLNSDETGTIQSLIQTVKRSLIVVSREMQSIS